MNYYKELNLDDTAIIRKLQDFVTDHKSELSSVLVPLDKEQILNKIPELGYLFEPLGITIKNVYIITVEPGPQTVIHRDSGQYISRINIPIFGCEQSITKFYTSDKPGIKKIVNNKYNTPFIYFDPVDCTEVDGFTLRQASIIKVRELHRVCFLPTATTTRVSCSIGFHEDIEHLYD